jgi:hypothetical protein
VIEVDRFGLHRQDNLVFLHEQDRKGRCLSPGLAKLKSPFKVRVPHWLYCPHAFEAPEEGPALDHPLVRAMGPDQEAGIFHLPAVHQNWLWRLSALTPGGERTVEPWFTLKTPRMRRVDPKLTITNAAPLVILDWGPADFNDMERLAAMPRTRNVIFSGPVKVPGTTVLDPAGLDWNHDWLTESRRQLYHLIRKGA